MSSGAAAAARMLCRDVSTSTALSLVTALIESRVQSANKGMTEQQVGSQCIKQEGCCILRHKRSKVLMACALRESSSLGFKADGQHVNERSEIAHTCNWRIPTEIHYIC